MFDEQFLRRVAETADEEKKEALGKWTHEKQSIAMLGELFREIRSKYEQAKKKWVESQCTGFVEIITAIERFTDEHKRLTLMSKIETNYIKGICEQTMEKWKEDSQCIEFREKAKTLITEFIDPPEDEEQSKTTLDDLKKKIQNLEGKDHSFIQFMGRIKPSLEHL
ncbi:hypothetical protein GJAV_G00169320, partial [Gymnothorax javanicus]